MFFIKYLKPEITFRGKNITFMINFKQVKRMKQEKIGKFIKEKRLKKNLTQSEFANILGVTERTVSNWENGKNLPDPAEGSTNI